MTDTDDQRYFARHRRRPRFRAIDGRRSDRSRAGAFALTPRDIDIVAAIARHRFLSSDQITRLFGEGRTRARLTELFHASYVQRPLRQRDLNWTTRAGQLTPGSHPMVYSLSTEGARLLGEHSRLPWGARGKRNWQRDYDNATRIYIAHTLGIADVRIAADLAVARREGWTIRHDAEQVEAGLPRDYERWPGSPWSMLPTVPREHTVVKDGRATVERWSEQIAVVCDAAFSIDNPVTRRTLNFFCEIDMGNMPVARYARGVLSAKGTSLMKKCLAYQAAFEQRLEHELYGWSNFKVLILTTTRARVDSLQKALAEEFGADRKGLFRIGILEDLKNDLLDQPFTDVSGGTATLIETDGR